MSSFQAQDLHWPNRFAQLGPRFATALPARGLPEPHWIATSPACAAWLGWPADWHQQAADALPVFSGQSTWPGMAPRASVYSGHQFGVWAGQLGDGRALWLGELQTPNGPQELQLKGAGMTPYSRMGDGRAVLRSSIREFLCSEAMHHLGIATTRALCLTGSALPVRRERVETAAVVTRVAPSFLRFGHLEHFAHHGQTEDLRTLVDFIIGHYYPACAEAPTPALALLAEVSRRTATLMAQWQSVGFCHGVMNTDNMSLLGLTIDYGPFGFLDHFDPGHVCNHSDTQGRYAFGRQPQVAWWNLHALAQALLPLVGDGRGDEADVDALRQALAPFSIHFSQAMSALMRAKLGLQTTQDDDTALVEDWLSLMAAQAADHTLSWRRLADLEVQSTLADGIAVSRPGAAPLRDLFVDRAAVDAWAQRYARRLQQEASVDSERQHRMQSVNPKYILRNHLAEQAIRQAEAGDFSEVQRLLTVLARPFDEQAEHADLAALPPDWAQHLEISCSS